ncbi:MAG: hypothetical protein WKF31_09030 [Thermoleophilaceae bacterium]
MGVKRETLARLLGRYGSAADGEQVDAWMRLLAALAAEPDPPPRYGRRRRPSTATWPIP